MVVLQNYFVRCIKTSRFERQIFGYRQRIRSPIDQSRTRKDNVGLRLTQFTCLEEPGLDMAVRIEARARIQIACYSTRITDQIKNDFDLPNGIRESVNISVTFGYRDPANKWLMPT